MKPKVIFGILLILIVLFGLNFITSDGNKNISTTPTSVPSNVFLIGALNMGYDHSFSSHRDSLCFNIWHNYLKGYYSETVSGKVIPVPYGWEYIDASCYRDSFFTPVADYSNAVSNVIRSIYANGSGCRSLLSRPKMECLIRGQSSIYQCEDSAYIPYDKFYSFNATETGRDVPDASYGNIRVKVCEPGIDPANAYVVKDVRVRNEQSGYNGQLDFFNDNYRYWYIKPKIRIPTGLSNNVEVCNIKLISYKGDTVFNKTLVAENFKNDSDIYNGKYLEEFYHNGSLTPFFVDGDTLKPDGGDNHFDIRIKWLGQCSMWIDYIKVENDIANDLLKGNYELVNNNWIKEESDQIGNTSGAYRFWVDEPTFNMLPAVKYVQNKLVNTYNANSSLLMTEYSCYNDPNGNLLSFTDYKRKQDSMRVTEIMTAIYPLAGHTKVPYYLQNHQYDSSMGLLGVPAGLSDYEIFMQSIFDNNLIGNEDGYVKGLTYPIKYIKESPPEKPFYFIPQVLMEYYHHGFENREPTTAEQEAMVDIAVSYGAKGILYYEYASWNDFTHCTGNPGDSYATGIVDSINIPLRINVYGEQKWKKLCALDSKLKTWGPTLMSLPIANTNSYSYRLKSQRDALVSSSYFNSATTFKPGGGIPLCNEYDLYIPTGLTYDCQEDTYLQIATMKNSEPYTDYFMVINRRCYPDSTNNNDGGARYVRVQFKPNYNSFTAFKNWNVINVENNSIVGAFNSGSYSNIDLNWFKPGEGKLYKIVPVMKSGGNLVCNESFSGLTFTNDSLVNGNGYDITIGGSNIISFNNKGGIVMNGGTFKSGTKFSYQPVVLQGASYWSGLELNNCTTVIIQNTTIKDIPYDSPVHLYGININDGNNITIKNSTFNNNSNAGFININFIDSVTNTPTYIIGNNITGDYCSEGYCVNSNGGPQSQVYLQNNYFNSSGGGSGIMLTNIAGGVLSGNVIYNCNYGINLMSSSVDFYGNTIINNDNSKGIYSLSGSTVNMSPSQSESGTEYVGGNNNISNIGSESNNIYVDNSYFYLDLGSNSFTISNENTNHLSGWFPEGDYCRETEVFKARYNCFYLNGNLDPKSNVSCGQGGNLINFDFYSQNSTCQAANDQFDVIALAEDINDSIPVKLSGNGGGYKEGQAMSVQTSSFFKSLKDTIIINMRKQNYDVVITKSTQLLNLFPDSTFSIDVLSKLYYANLKLDINGNKIGPLKTYFETLILNNPGNFSLIKRANYFIQKCKVVLKQYTSALQGFQEIINQNPYNFEGLVASWDYAATNLLVNSSGGIKGDLQLNNIETSEESNLSLYNMIDTLRNRKVNAGTYTTDDYDKKVFTKKDRETLQNSVESMYKSERTKQINKLQELEKKSKSDNESISKKSKSELKIMKTLGEVVKVKKPNTMSEHIKNVRKDISKVLVVEESNGNKTNNLIPQDYSLSQNYPNPFNPITKINYELPKDGKVKLVIYDILGREIKSLVNNEFKQAGRYTVEFNGTQYASGVYFYRIQVEGGKGFTAVKKMVLVK